MVDFILRHGNDLLAVECLAGFHVSQHNPRMFWYAQTRYTSLAMCTTLLSATAPRYVHVIPAPNAALCAEV